MDDGPWRVHRVRQYCYFWLSSDVVPASEITETLGLAPDRVTVKGSYRTSPRPMPGRHMWQIRSYRPGHIDEQASDVLRRIGPAAVKVRQLVDRGDAEAGLMLVRSFAYDEGGVGLLGWQLTREQVSLLAKMGAEIQATEEAP